MSIIPWALKQGVAWAKVKPSDDVPGSGGRGIVATADIAAGECLMSVPLAATLRVFPGCPPALALPAELWQQLAWPAQLALTLLQEVSLGERSRWADYVALLPAHVDLPATAWSEADIQQLQCGYVIAEVLQQRSEYAALQQQLAPYLAAAGLSQERLLWALAVTRSRAFAAPYTASPLAKLGLQLGFGKGGGKQQQGSQQPQQHVLTALLDLFNHSSAVQSEVEFVPDLRSPAFRVVAANAWRKGAEVLISYGSGSNDVLLQLYGFVEPDNPSDRFVVTALPEVLREQQPGLSQTATQGLQQVVFSRAGIPAAAAAQLAAALPGNGPGAASAPGRVVSYSQLAPGVRAVCAAAVASEMRALGVKPDEDEQLLAAFEQLPQQQATLTHKAAELATVEAKLEQLLALQQAEQPQQLADAGGQAGQQSSSDSELAGLLAACQELQHTLHEEVGQLRETVAAWSRLLAPGHKQTAVLFRLQKHQLLASCAAALDDTCRG